ncbi:hypothetical protein AB0D86_18150 [Streptomyces sp. NPDC048324]
MAAIDEQARAVLGWQPRDVVETIVASAESQIRRGLEPPDAG